MRNFKKEGVISWIITPDIFVNRIKLLRKIFFIPYFSISFAFFSYLYTSFKSKISAFVSLFLLIGFYVYIFYLRKNKKVEYYMDQRGLRVTKESKEKFYKWDDFKNYYSNNEVISKSRSRELHPIEENFKSNIIPPIFTLILKNSFKNWGQVSIITKLDNYRSVEKRLNSHLKKSNKMEVGTAYKVLSILIGILITIYIFYLLGRGEGIF